MRTELQYNLQKARALATELRCTLESIQEVNFISHVMELDEACTAVGQLESELDDMDSEIIGDGHVALKVEPYNAQA